MFKEIIEINWERFKKKKKSVVDKRMLHVLGENENIEKIWKEYFNLKGYANPFDKIISLIVKRPRDAIYFISKLFESAAYNNKLNVTDDDFDYALDAYTKYLYNNMIAELKAEFPEIDDIIKALQKTYIGLLNQFTYIPVETFYKIVKPILGKNGSNNIIKALMNNNYLVAIARKGKTILTTHEEFTNIIEEKKFKFFKKHKVKLHMRLIPFAE
jgi:hypothetical protein